MSQDPGSSGQSVYEVAKRMGTTPNMIRQAIYAGHLKAYKFTPKIVRIMPEDLEIG